MVCRSGISNHLADCLRLSLVHLPTTERTVRLDGRAMLRTWVPLMNRTGAADITVPFCQVVRSKVNLAKHQSEATRGRKRATHERMVKRRVLERETECEKLYVAKTTLG